MRISSPILLTGDTWPSVTPKEQVEELPHISATFTKEGGRLNISGTNRLLDGDIKDLEIILKDDKITLTFMNSNPVSGARYNLELKDDKLVGIAKTNRGESDIELAPHPTK